MAGSRRYRCGPAAKLLGLPLLKKMPSHLAHAPAPVIHARPAERGDLDALLDLEHRVFATDRLSRRSLRHFLQSKSAQVIVADDGQMARRRGGRAVPSGLVGGPSLLDRSRPASQRPRAWVRCCSRRPRRRPRARLPSIRLEVHETNHAAISRYRKSGYREFGRHARYYDDGGDALRFEKRLARRLPGLAAPPPYFHQTTEFTCGPACMMMALAWADPVQPDRRRSSSSSGVRPRTIFMAGGPGGCEPYRNGGDAQAARAPPGDSCEPRRTLLPRHRPRSADKRRVMRLTQSEFQREAKALGIPSHLTPVSESVLMRAFDAGSVAIVLVSGYHMVPRGRPHWIFAFGRDGRHVLMHDPAANRDDQGMAHAA